MQMKADVRKGGRGGIGSNAGDFSQYFLKLF